MKPGTIRGYNDFAKWRATIDGELVAARYIFRRKRYAVAFANHYMHSTPTTEGEAEQLAKKYQGILYHYRRSQKYPENDPMF